MRRAVFLVVVLIVGCRGNEAASRAAGSWPGAFVVDGNRQSVKGQLELYVTGPKFHLTLRTKDQSFVVSGKWTAEKYRVTMTADRFDFQNPSEEDQKAFKLRIIQPDEVRAAFGHPVVLDESPDRRKLTGLEMSLGPLLGRLEFERPIPR